MSCQPFELDPKPLVTTFAPCIDGAKTWKPVGYLAPDH